MKALFFEEFGGPEVLQFGTLSSPDLVEGHLLIDVHYAGVNPINWKVRRGVYAKMFKHQFPIVAGFDYSGIVQAVGEGVSGFAIGDRVFGMNPLDVFRHGTYAEVTLAPSTSAGHIPDGITFEAAAAIPTVALTASKSLIDFGALGPGVHHPMV